MRRILDLYDHSTSTTTHPPTGGWVVCVDEFGPLNLLSRKGKAWRPAKSPRRLRATYRRTQGDLRRELTAALRTGRTVRKPRKDGKRQPRFTAPMIMISDRPAEADDRAVPATGKET